MTAVNLTTPTGQVIYTAPGDTTPTTVDHSGTIVPSPLGALSTWTPTITAATGAYTSVTVQRAVYQRVGNFVFFEVAFTVVTIGTGSGATNITLPVTPANATGPAVVDGDNPFTGLFARGTISGGILSVTSHTGTDLVSASGHPPAISGFYRVA